MTDLGFKPHGKRVLVQPLAAPTKVGSIMLPSNALEQRTGEAIVVALGGKVPPELGVRVGDRVYTDRFQGQPIEIKGEMYRLHEPQEILAVITAA